MTAQMVHTAQVPTGSQRAGQHSAVKHFTAAAAACLGIAIAVAPLLLPSLSDWLPSLRRQLQLALPFRLQPYPGKCVRESTLFDDAYKEEMWWGTYRPGFYCGALIPVSRKALCCAFAACGMAQPPRKRKSYMYIPRTCVQYITTRRMYHGRQRITESTLRERLCKAGLPTCVAEATRLSDPYMQLRRMSRIACSAAHA